MFPPKNAADPLGNSSILPAASGRTVIHGGRVVAEWLQLVWAGGRPATLHYRDGRK
jgi:hypothetical protein